LQKVIKANPKVQKVLGETVEEVIEEAPVRQTTTAAIETPEAEVRMQE